MFSERTARCPLPVGAPLVLAAAQLTVGFLAQHAIAHAVDEHDFVHVGGQRAAQCVLKRIELQAQLCLVGEPYFWAGRAWAR